MTNYDYEYYIKYEDSNHCLIPYMCRYYTCKSFITSIESTIWIYFTLRGCKLLPQRVGQDLVFSPMQNVVLPLLVV